MSKNNQKTKEPQSLLDILTECGRLKNSIEQTITVAHYQYKETDKVQLKRLLQTEGTEEYNAYHEGVALGDHEIKTALHKGSRKGDTLSVEALNNQQKNEAVDQAIKDNFFPRD